MKKYLDKIMFWLICYAVANLVASMAIMEIGKVFLLIHLGVTIILIIYVTFQEKGGQLFNTDGLLRGAFGIASGLGITLGITWIVSTIFAIDFYIAYLIMSLGQCFGGTDNK